MVKDASLDDETVQLDQDSVALYRALTRLVRVYQFRDRDRVCVRGITVTQCYALTTLMWHGPMTLIALTNHLYLDKSTMSRVVDAMVEKGLVRRRTHRDSRRAVELSLTAKGRRLHSTIQNDVIKSERELLADFSPRTRHDIVKVIGRLADLAEERTQR